MNLLLDTHILLWSLLSPDNLKKKVRQELEAPNNTLWLSPISVWEILLLIEKNRVEVDAEPHYWIKRILRSIPVKEAQLTHEIAIQARTIDLRHQDPADRFIAATANVYGMTLVTADKRLLESKLISTLANQ